MTDAFELFMRRRRLDLVDAMPVAIRRLVHEYDLALVAAARARGVRSTAKIRAVCEARRDLAARLKESV